jgi:hypothetical protein
MIHNHWLRITASDCESWCAMLRQWLCIMVIYDEPVAINHGVLLWAFTHHDSQPLAEYNTP